MSDYSSLQCTLLGALPHTSASKDASDLNKLDGDPGRRISNKSSAKTLDVYAHLAESIVAVLRFA
jgi:hypothetical protein